LTTTAYKYLKIGINIRPVSYVDIIFGIMEATGYHCHVKWITIIEKRTTPAVYLRSVAIDS